MGDHGHANNPYNARARTYPSAESPVYHLPMQHTWSPGGSGGTGLGAGLSPGSGSSGTPSGAGQGQPWGRGMKGESGAVAKFESFEDGDDDDEDGSANGDGAPEGGKEGEAAKKKSTRGSRACTGELSSAQRPRGDGAPS